MLDDEHLGKFLEAFHYVTLGGVVVKRISIDPSDNLM